MTKQVLFIQGAGEGAHAEDAALAESLRAALGPDYEVIYPLMPDEGDPREDAWRGRIAAELESFGDGVILVGHSAGAAALVSLLAGGGIAAEKIAGVFLAAAPFFGAGGWEVEGFALPERLGERLPDAPVFLYHGSRDAIVPPGHLDLYAEALPGAALRRLEGRDHQLDGDMSEVAVDIRTVAARLRGS